jgi:hypothetical protein
LKYVLSGSGIVTDTPVCLLQADCQLQPGDFFVASRIFIFLLTQSCDEKFFSTVCRGIETSPFDRGGNKTNKANMRQRRYNSLLATTEHT